MEDKDVDIFDLIAEGEHEQQDFKYRIDEPAKIAKTLCAFANTKGGRLLVGVKDNGTIKGIDPEEEYYVVEAAAQRFCSPEIPFSYKIWADPKDSKKLVLQIDVAESEQKPHRAINEEKKWLPYIRIEDDTLLANRITVGVWKKQQSPIKKPEVLTDRQLDLLRSIHRMEPCTISAIYRNVKMSSKQIDQLLVMFISWGLVKQELNKEKATYSCLDVQKIDW